MPRRGSSLLLLTDGLRSFWDRRLRRSGRGPDLTEFARADIGGGFAGGDVAVLANCGRIGSWSGGGVGGNILRLMGGADCCRTLLWRSVLTRFDAAKEIVSRGRSSLAAPPMAFFFASEPAKPVNAFAWSEAATSLAFPR